MEITNNHNLPEAIYHAIANDVYDGPKATEEKRISCTATIQPVQKYVLTKRHYHELKEDAADRLWSLMGQSVHAILERTDTKNNIVEERLERKIGGWTVSGKVDIMNERLLSDYKITSVWQYIHAKSGKVEHEQQLNINRWLALPVFPYITDLQTNLILRDWSAGKAKGNPDFPPIPLVSVQLRVWHPIEVEAFLSARLAKIDAAMALPDAQLPECSPEEMWETPTMFAVKKQGGKRALKLYAKREDAEAALGPGLVVEVRPGERKRCSEYCPVSHLCAQHKAYMAAHGPIKGEEE